MATFQTPTQELFDGIPADQRKSISSELRAGIAALTKDPATRTLYEGFACMIRSSPLSDKYNDAAILSGMDDILQLGEKHPVKPSSVESDILRDLILSPPGIPRDVITLFVVKRFWDMLDHYPKPKGPSPPEYRFRQADGSNNNPDFPDAGKAGLVYGTTAPASKTVNENRPDPGEIFDLLMGRGENAFEPQPAGFSSFFFAHAALITHDIFNTDPTNHNINRASSYLDLAPLYGNNQTEQNQIRTFADGEVKRDSFLDRRILGLPPAVSVMVIMYARFHNYAARTLAAINEGGRFTVPDAADAAAVKARDEELFQVARLVTNGLYINVSVNDYVRAIFNVNQSTSTWGLAPRAPTFMIPRGVGNTVSREFNLLYRFHSIQSQTDAAWITSFMEEMFPGQDVPNLTREQFFTGLIRWMMSIPEDPLKRTFHGLVRNPDGSYNDGDLIAVLQTAIDDPAGAFGTNHVPRVLRALEKEAIELGREWNVASLNEFRAFFNMSRLEKFEDINPDPVVVANLKKLYKTTDDVELYPGLFAEVTGERVDPAVGICAPRTVAGAILGDAVSLIRGDRYMTTDYKPDLLTAWGFNEVSTDKQVLSGSKIYHLILTALPDWVRFNSSYAMQPFYTTAESITIGTKLQTSHLFSFDAPAEIKPPVALSAYATVAAVLQDQANYTIQQSGYLPSYMPEDPVAQQQQWTLIWSSLVAGGGVQLFSEFAELITLTLLDKRRAKVRGTTQYKVDIVKEIGNIAALQFASVISYLPLRFGFVSGGTYGEDKLAALFTDLLEYSAYDYEPTKTWGVRARLAAGMPGLTEAVTQRVNALTGSPAGGTDGADGSAIQTFGANFTKALLTQGTDVAVTSDILVGNGYSVLSSVGLVFAQVIDFYLRPENKTYWEQIVALSAKTRPAAGKAGDDATLTKYILEGARLTSTTTSVRTVSPADGQPITLVVDQAGTRVTFNKGDRVISSTDANLDPAAFPNPTVVDLTRPLELYLVFGSAPRERLGRDVGLVCLVKMLRSVATLPNVCRAPGDAGQLKLVTRPGGLKQYMTPDLSAFSSFPTTMTLYFDQDAAVDVAVR